jgi:hypothetical protein
MKKVVTAASRRRLKTWLRTCATFSAATSLLPEGEDWANVGVRGVR